jgi:hypothetical protein
VLTWGYVHSFSRAKAATLLALVVAAGAALLWVAAAPAADSGPTALPFSPSTALGGAVRTTWGFRFTADGPIDASHPIVVTAPNSAFTKSIFPDATGASMVDLTTGQDDTNGANVTTASSASLVPSHPIAAGDVVALSMNRVINPNAGTSFSSISVSEGGATLHPGAGAFDATTHAVGELEFSPSTTAGGATDVTWGYRFRLSGRLPLRSQISVTAPAGGSFGLGHFTLVDLSTYTNHHSDVGDTISPDGSTATIGIGSSYSPGDLIQIEFTGATNPPAGTAFSTTAVTTDADTVAAHPGGGTFTAVNSISGVTFTPSTSAGGASANWGIAFQTSATGRLLDGSTVVLGIPPGATLPTATGSYSLRDDTTGGGPYAAHSVSVGSSSVTLTLSVPNLAVIGAGDRLSLVVHGVTNPAAGVAASDISLATGSDPGPVTAVAPAAAAASGTVTGVTLWQTTVAAGASGVVWGTRFRVSDQGGLTGGSGTVTLSGPAGSFHSNPFTVIEDLTSGVSCANCAATQAADGSSVTVKPNFSVAPGDVIVLEAHAVTNPAAGPVAAGGFGVSTSSDGTVAHPATGVTFTAPDAPAAVSVSPSTVAAGATHTAWTVLFTASSSGAIADDGRQPAELELALPPGTTVENGRDFGVYDLTSGSFQEFAGNATVGSSSASFFIPAAISPGDELALVLAGVTNPPAGGVAGSATTVSTSSDSVAAGAAGAVTFVPQSLPTTDLLQGTDGAASATDDQLFGEFTTSPTGQLASSAARYATETLTAPAGTQFSSANCFETFDLTTGLRGCAVSTAGSVSGSSYSVKPGFSVGAGDLVAFSVKAAANPPSGLTTPTGFRLSTSSDDGSPTATGDNVSGSEGQALTGPVLTIDGSCPQSGTIDWGDGTTSAATISCQGLIATLSGTHTYADFGAYTVATSTSDGLSGTSTATIADAPLTASPGTGLTATAGAPFTGVVARFTDSNPFGKAADFTTSIDWGDGTTSAGTVTFGSGHFSVHGAHTYSTAGNKTVTVDIADAGGATATTVASLTVNAPGAPAVTLTAPANNATLNTATPTFSGAAGTGPADAPQVTVKVYAGGAVSSNPVQTLSATASGGSWSVPASGALANGTYTAQAQQSTTTGVTGLSSAHTFRIKAPAPPPPPVQQGPGSGGGPPAGCQNTVAYGTFAATGCLQAVIGASQIPAPEKRTLCRHRKLKASACEAALTRQIKTKADPLIAQAIVRVNGLDITPRGSGVVLFDPKSRVVISSNAAVQILGDRVTLHNGSIELDGAGDVPALDANLNKLLGAGGLTAQALKLGGFNLTGTLSVKLIHQATSLQAAVALPNLFSAVGGGSLTAQAKATADNADDVQFNELLIKAPPMGFGGFELSNVAFCYQNHVSDNFCQPRTHVGFGNADPSFPTWNVTAKAKMLGVTLDAAPPPATYGIGFVNGDFAFGGAAATIGGGGIPLSPGVSLTKFGGSFGVNPIRATGTVGLTVGGVASIDGSLFVVVPTDGQKYSFTGTELGPVIKPPLALPKVTVNQFALAAGGDVGLKIPGFDKPVPLADGYLVYAYPTYIAAGGGFNVNLFSGALVVDGGLQGALNFGNGMFDVEGGVGLQVNAGPLQAGFNAQAVVSNIGIAGCGSVNAFGASASAGVGYKWGQGFDGVNVMLGSCDLTPYRVAVSASSASARARLAATGTTLQVAGGLPNEMIKVAGSGAPPDITITGPNGVRASTAGQLAAQTAPFMIKRDPRDATTYIAILHPPAGSYSIAANPGSPAITRVMSAHGFTPTIKTHVSGHGARRRLHYTVGSDQPGEKVTFVERGKGVEELIGTTGKRHGVIHFRPALGPGGRRQIVATANLGGMPLVLSPGSAAPGQKLVASYKAPGPLHLGRAHGLRARRTAGRLTVSFKRVHGARRYVVLVDLRSGMRSDFVVKRPSLRISVPSVGPSGGTVTVKALGDGLHSVDGRAAKATVTPAKRKRHRPTHRHH